MSLEADWDYENIWDETIIARKILKQNIVPFANDGAGGLISFSASGNSGIWVNSSDPHERMDLASNFDDFVDLLKP